MALAELGCVPIGAAKRPPAAGYRSDTGCTFCSGAFSTGWPSPSPTDARQPTAPIATARLGPAPALHPPARLDLQSRPSPNRPDVRDIVPRPAPPVVSDPEIRRAHPCRCPCGAPAGSHVRTQPDRSGKSYTPIGHQNHVATRSLSRGLVETGRAVRRGAPMTTHETGTITSEPTMAPSSLTGLPLMLTVGEAAAVLRISRTSAYKLAHEWRASRGATGLPTVRLGSRVMVRRVDLAAIVGLGADG